MKTETIIRVIYPDGEKEIFSTSEYEYMWDGDELILKQSNKIIRISGNIAVKEYQFLGEIKHD